MVEIMPSSIETSTNCPRPVFRAWAYAASMPIVASNPALMSATGLPLFTGGRIKAETAVADIELRKLAQTERDLRNQIALEVKTSLAELQSAQSEVDAANLGVTLAKEGVEQAQDRFRRSVAANSHGWEILCPFGFEATWNGGLAAQDVTIPGCKDAATSAGCPWPSFERVVRRALGT